MPAFEVAEYGQAVQWWPATTPDNYGTPRVRSRRQMQARWEDRQVETSDPEGRTTATDAVLLTTEAVPVGSVVWLGSDADWPNNDTLTPGTHEPLMSVVYSRRIPDPKSRTHYREVGLVRLGHTLPTVV